MIYYVTARRHDGLVGAGRAVEADTPAEAIAIANAALPARWSASDAELLTAKEEAEYREKFGDGFILRPTRH